MTTWPDPTRPGVPLNPERDGAHQVTHASDSYPIKGPWVVLWHPVEDHWVDAFGNFIKPSQMAQHRYVGPCATPAEVEAICAEAFKQGAEAAIIEMRAEAMHLEADARDGLRGGSPPGVYDEAARWIKWAAEQTEKSLKTGDLSLPEPAP